MDAGVRKFSLFYVEMFLLLSQGIPSPAGKAALNGPPGLGVVGSESIPCKMIIDSSLLEMVPDSKFALVNAASMNCRHP